MKSHYLLLASFPVIFLISLLLYFASQKSQVVSIQATTTPSKLVTETITSPSAQKDTNFFKIIKDVGEPQYDRFGLTESDFQKIQAANFTHLSVNFDLCAADSDVKWFLDTAHKYKLQVILNAGAGDAEWGYQCNEEPYPINQKPIWQTDLVTKWITKWKNHPALFAWDISNEGGLNFPNGENNQAIGEKWQQNAVTLTQIQKAASDVRKADPNHPRYMRMSGYVFYENDSNFFAPELGNPFAAGIAEYVMVNSYSNTDDYDPELVTNVAAKAQKSIKTVDSNTQIIFALGAWQEPPMWVRPSSEQLQADYEQATQFNPAGLGYFKYGAATGNDWYAPDPTRGSPSLWRLMTALNGS